MGSINSGERMSVCLFFWEVFGVGEVLLFFFLDFCVKYGSFMRVWVVVMVVCGFFDENRVWYLLGCFIRFC